MAGKALRDSKGRFNGSTKGFRAGVMRAAKSPRTARTAGALAGAAKWGAVGAVVAGPGGAAIGARIGGQVGYNKVVRRQSSNRTQGRVKVARS